MLRIFIILIIIGVIIYMTDERMCDLPLKMSPSIDLANWMSLFSDAIAHVPLHTLCLPGTHNSGAYALSTHILGNVPAWIRMVYDITQGAPSHVIRTWGEAQGVSVRGQLNRGARYLDLRVMLHEGHYFSTHGMLGAPYEVILNDVCTFLDACPGEIVICDFNHFHHFTKREHHEAFIHLVQRYIGRHIAPPYTGKETYAELCANNTRAICLYGDTTMIQSPWPRAYTYCDLEEKLCHTVMDTSRGFFVLQGVVTPGANRIARSILPGRRTRSLQELASEVSPRICHLIESGHLDAHCIVMLDYIDLVDVSSLLLHAYNGDTSK